MDLLGAPTGTAAVTWLVLGLVLGIGLVVLVGIGTALAVRRRGRVPADPGGDDLPGFLESPPGSGSPTAAAGWAALSAPPAPAPVTSRLWRDALVPLAALAVAVLLLGTAAVVVTTSRADDRPAHPRPSTAPAASGAAARLTFGGVVLEARAVGVTATYPVVEIATEDGRTVARVELPTFNCLTGDAPADPVAAGCAPAGTEYAQLRSPDLTVRPDGGGLRIAGRFPTELHPNGSAPAATGRAYELRITATPTGAAAADGWRPARGTLELGPGRTTTVDRPGLNVLRAGS